MFGCPGCKRVRLLKSDQSDKIRKQLREGLAY